MDQDQIARLKQLAELRSAGVLSEDEFAAAKASVLKGALADEGPGVEGGIPDSQGNAEGIANAVVNFSVVRPSAKQSVFIVTDAGNDYRLEFNMPVGGKSVEVAINGVKKVGKLARTSMLSMSFEGTIALPNGRALRVLSYRHGATIWSQTKSVTFVNADENRVVM